jgi:serine/threonine protein kinase/Tol biopolymer transport system component
MTPEEYRRAGELFDQLRDMTGDERQAALDAACAGNTSLRTQVLRLLEADNLATGGAFLERRAIDDVARLLTPDAPQSHAPGTVLGHYCLGSRIGSGGMSIVYEAQDLRLHRRVAIKVLALVFEAEGPERIKRFQQEARAASLLAHPNIVAIFDADVDQGCYYIAMEFVEGKTLRQLIAAGGASIDSRMVLDLLAQTAAALGAAHAAGIVHRDIKPENIMVRPDGLVKVLDFGLAKQRERSELPEVSDLRTRPGHLAGTIQYLSPEQVAGKPVDARSDLFSLGVVAYELATGQRPFGGPTDGAIFDAILHHAPDLPSAVRPGLGDDLDALILQSLEKECELRFQTAGDLASSCKRLIRDSSRSMELPRAPARKRVSSLEKTPVARPAHSLARRTLPWLAAAAAVVGLVTLRTLDLRPARSDSPEVRLDVVIPESGEGSSFALSPDGRQIAFVASVQGHRRLWVRALDSTEAQPLRGGEGATSPFWSPDSRSLAFFADFKLKRIDLGGAQPQMLAPVASLAPQGTWGMDGVILFTPSGLTPLSRVPASGGQPTPAVDLPKANSNQLAPRFLPGGRQFLFVVNGADPSIWLGSLSGAAYRRITSLAVGTDSAAEYLPPGWLVRVRQNTLEAQRFDAGLGRLSGDPVPLDRSVRTDALTMAGFFSVSASGAIAWRSGGGDRRQLIWFNRAGENVGSFGDIGDSTMFSPEIAPDGKRVATMRGPVGSSDIWVQEGVRNTRFTIDPADDRYPIWSPDGARLAFASNRNGAYDLYDKAADGSGSERLLLPSPDFKRPNSWSPDGRFILYWTAQNNGDLMVLPLTGDRKPFPFVSTPFDEQQGAFSPDGKWVAYQSDKSGRFEIYVRPFPGPGAESQVSAEGGHSPRWRADGRQLYFLAPDLKMMAAKTETKGATFTASAPESLFQTRINQATNRQQYDVARDGRFLILTDLPEMSSEPIHLLLHWHPLLR